MENKEWYLYVVDHHEGPFTAGEIKKLVKKGEAKTSSYVWKEGLDDWMLMADVTEFGPGTSGSDGHGAFTFITNLFRKKPAPAALEPAPADTSSGGVSAGPDVSDVNPSDSVWCLNSQKQFSGPYSMKNLVRKINDGEVSVEDSVWHEGWSSFVRISNIPAFMEGVKPDVLSGKVDKKKKKKSGSETPSAAMALGLGGGSSVRKYRWYRSRKFQSILTILMLAALYQGLVTGKLDVVLELIPGAKEPVQAKIKEFNLAPLPLDNADAVLGSAGDFAMSLMGPLVGYLPEPIKGYFSPLELPEGLKPNDVETLREAALTDVKSGIRVATALAPGEVANPSFLVATNAPDGAVFTVTLRAKENGIIGALGYEKTIQVQASKRLATTPGFTHEGAKPIPKGEYVLIVYEADQQPVAEMSEALSRTARKTTPGVVPAGKVAFVVDSFFLGGLKDAGFALKLKEYQGKVKERLSAEAAELRELALLLDSKANESATRFNTLSAAPAGPARKNAWAQYRAEYAKIMGQVKLSVDKLTPATRKDFVLPQLYEALAQTYQLTEQLHQAETDVLEKNVDKQVVSDLAVKAAAAIKNLKDDIAKVTK